MEAISLKAEELFKVGGFGVTNSLLLTFVVCLILMVSSFILKRRIRLLPGRIQGGVEMALEWFLDLMSGTLGTKEKALRYFPLIATIFIFILTSNLLGIFPGVGSVSWQEGGHHIPLFRSPAADLNFTLAFAIISVVAANLLGMAAVGILPHLGKFFNFRNPITFFIGILELVSEFAKVISLSFRLFGNVFAGEVLLTIIFFLAPYFIPLPFLFLELFVGLIQAFLFAMLTLVSISLHTTVEEH